MKAIKGQSGHQIILNEKKKKLNYENLESAYNTTKCVSKQPTHTRIKFV